MEKSGFVPTPNYVVNTSPEKFQLVWKVEGVTVAESDALNHALVNEFGGDPAATDAARVLRLPGFASKKYGTDFYVHARAESTQMYHLHDFRLEIDQQDSVRDQHRPAADERSLAESCR